MTEVSKLKKKLECHELIILLCYGEIVEIFYVVHYFCKALKFSHIRNWFISACYEHIHRHQVYF
jgi:hypothetical protein